MPLLEVKDIGYKTNGENPLRALSVIRTMRSHVLLGTNGTGKSTLAYL